MQSKQKYPPEELLFRIKVWCDLQERSQQEVRDKLYSWGLHREECEGTIATLIEENYLNEERFARAYVGGKFRIKQWGRNKILQGLKLKKVSSYCIKLGLQEINEEDYLQTLQQLLEKKWKMVSGGNMLEKQQKVGSYLLQRGFESELVWRELQEFSESKTKR